MWLILAVLLLALLYHLATSTFGYWRKKGVPHERPRPLVGNLSSVLLQNRSLAEELKRVYDKFPEERYVGMYQFRLPTLILRDPELIKQIAVKEFDSFPEHTVFASPDADPLWSNNLFAMPGGENWRDIRGVLSPVFTTTKLKAMFGLIKECAQQFVDHLEEEQGFVALEMKDAFAKVTNDIIATTAFGITCNSMKNPKNEFFLMGKDASNLKGLATTIKFFIAAISPRLTTLLRVRFIRKPTADFFNRIMKETVAVREQNNTVRPDVIHLLMEARKERESNHHVQNGKKKAAITDDVFTAQTVVFFLAGFDTVSTAMSYTAYELALNPEIQDRLYEEVQGVKGDNVAYDELMGMKYMDMVVSEALRKWPPFAVTDRKTKRSFTVEPRHPHERPWTIDAGVTCQIPIFSLHRDPKYYPEPEKFDPERFNDENKHNIPPFAYVPFGAGPRICIGSRFALLEVKAVIFYIMRKFQIVPIEQTQIPLRLSKREVNPVPEKGFWLGLRPRGNC